MVGAGFNHQNELFYCSHWTCEIEKCFVDSLVDHKRNGSFRRDRTNCHAVLCSVFDLNAAFGSELSYSYCQRRLTKLKIRFKVFRWITSLAAVEWDTGSNVISADDYIWDQISKARKIGKAYVNSLEPHWNALLLLFGEDWSDDTLEDEHEFFDCVGTCPDDAWVHGIPPHESDLESYESWLSDGDSDGNPSWLAFMHEYYASDSDPNSVNMHKNHFRLPPPEPNQSPPNMASQKSATTRSSCASNDPESSPHHAPKRKSVVLHLRSCKPIYCGRI